MRYALSEVVQVDVVSTKRVAWGGYSFTCMVLPCMNCIEHDHEGSTVEFKLS